MKANAGHHASNGFFGQERTVFYVGGCVSMDWDFDCIKLAHPLNYLID